MNTNQFLSMQRILMVMKRDIMENWKTNFFRFCGLFGAFVVAVIGNMWGMSHDAFSNPEFYYQRFCSTLTLTFGTITFFAGLIYASCMLENMATKEQRIAYLMLPATMIEKFLARFLISTVGCAVIIGVAMLLAEITHYLLLPLFQLPDIFRRSILIDVLSRLWGNYADAFPLFSGQWCGFFSAQICMWVLTIWHHSLYILGGCYWYHKAFLKTVGTLLSISLFCSFIVAQILDWMDADSLFEFFHWWEEHTQWMTVNQVFMLVTFFFTTFTLFNWWLGYRLFLRAQVITPKFRKL